jgi:hypothetical protein
MGHLVWADPGIKLVAGEEPEFQGGVASTEIFAAFSCPIRELRAVTTIGK